jgi:hypothetical protein
MVRPKRGKYPIHSCKKLAPQPNVANYILTDKANTQQASGTGRNHSSSDHLLS